MIYDEYETGVGKPEVGIKKIVMEKIRNLRFQVALIPGFIVLLTLFGLK